MTLSPGSRRYGHGKLTLIVGERTSNQHLRQMLSVFR